MKKNYKRKPITKNGVFLLNNGKWVARFYDKKISRYRTISVHNSENEALIAFNETIDKS